MQAEAGRGRRRDRDRPPRSRTAWGTWTTRRTWPRTSATSTRGSVAAASRGSPSPARSPTPSSTRPGPEVGWSRIISCGAEVALDLTTTWPGASTTRRPTAWSSSSRGSSARSGSWRSPTGLWSSGKPILALKVGRSPQAQAAAIAHSGSLAGEALVVDAALDAAGVQRFSDLDELLEAAELNAGCRPPGQGRRPGQGGRSSPSAPARRRSSPTWRRRTASTCRRSPSMPASGSCATCRPSATSATRWTRGARATPRAPTPRPSRRSPSRAHSTSSGWSTTSRTGRCPARRRSRPSSPASSPRPSPTDPGVLPVYVSLTSGEPTPEVQARLDAAGGIPLLRGAREALAALGARAPGSGGGPGASRTGRPGPRGRSSPSIARRWCASRPADGPARLPAPPARAREPRAAGAARACRSPARSPRWSPAPRSWPPRRWAGPWS